MRISIQITVVSVGLVCAAPALAQSDPSTMTPAQQRKQHFEQLSKVQAQPLERSNPLFTPAKDAKAQQVDARIVAVDDGGVLVAVPVSQDDWEMLSRNLKVVTRPQDVRTNTLFNKELYVRYALAPSAPDATKLEARTGQVVKLEVQRTEANRLVIMFWRD